MAGLFDRLQDELERRERQEGVSPLDVLDLAPELRALMARMTRAGSMTLPEVMDATGMGTAEAQALIDKLVDRGFVKAEGDPASPTYKRFMGQRRRRAISLDIWDALSDQLDDAPADE